MLEATSKRSWHRWSFRCGGSSCSLAYHPNSELFNHALVGSSTVCCCPLLLLLDSHCQQVAIGRCCCYWKMKPVATSSNQDDSESFVSAASSETAGRLIWPAGHTGRQALVLLGWLVIRNRCWIVGEYDPLLNPLLSNDFLLRWWTTMAGDDPLSTSGSGAL